MKSWDLLSQHQLKGGLEGDILQDRPWSVMGDASQVATSTSKQITVEAFRGLGQTSELDAVNEVTEV